MNCDTLQLKVCDTGSGARISDVEQTHTIQGTIPFLAPELL